MFHSRVKRETGNLLLVSCSCLLLQTQHFPKHHIELLCSHLMSGVSMSFRAHAGCSTQAALLARRAERAKIRPDWEKLWRSDHKKWHWICLDDNTPIIIQYHYPIIIHDVHWSLLFIASIHFIFATENSGHGGCLVRVIPAAQVSSLRAKPQVGLIRETNIQGGAPPPVMLVVHKHNIWHRHIYYEPKFLEWETNLANELGHHLVCSYWKWPIYSWFTYENSDFP